MSGPGGEKTQPTGTALEEVVVEVEEDVSLLDVWLLEVVVEVVLLVLLLLEAVVVEVVEEVVCEEVVE